MMKKLLAVAVGMMVVGGVIADVEYLDAEGRVQTCPEVEVVTDMTEELKDGCWYAVEGRVSRTSFTVRGSAHLILLDDCHLNVEEGIFVPRASSITIYGQCGGTGELNAKGAAGNAGIGGRYGDGSQTDDFDCGSVTINGGVVYALGSYAYGADRQMVCGAAGIGGTASGSGGVVTVNGGRVIASGFNNAAGIGGGYFSGDQFRSGSGGDVTIRGGTVTFTPDLPHIGGGKDGDPGTVTILGGSIDAEIQGDVQKDGSGAQVHKVTLELPRAIANGNGRISFRGLGQYGLRDVIPFGRCVFFWLPDGRYEVVATVDQAGIGVRTATYAFAVAGGDVVCQPQELGMSVNGEDLALGCGEGWAYQDNMLSITNQGRYVLAGSSTNGEVQVRVAASNCDVVLDEAIIYTQGRSALVVEQGQTGISLEMKGGVSHLAATHATDGVAFPALEVNSALTVDFAPEADVLQSATCVFNSGDSPAIGGSGSVSVVGGCLRVWSAGQAVRCAGGFGIAQESANAMIARAGMNWDAMRFVSGENPAASIVEIAPSRTITIPAEIANVSSVVVSNAFEEIIGISQDGQTVYRAMQADSIAIAYETVDGYAVLLANPQRFQLRAEDVVIGSSECPLPDVRRVLTLTLPRSVEGLLYEVREDGRGVAGRETSSELVYVVHQGCAVQVVCRAAEGWQIVDAWSVVDFNPIDGSKVLSEADLPQAWRLFTVTVPDVANAVHAVTTNGIRSAGNAGVYTILSNAEVAVTFMAAPNYRIATNGAKSWILTGDVIFGTTEGFPRPTLDGIPGTVAAPWTIGENVQAYTNRAGVLAIVGRGAMNDFADATDVPWNPSVVTSVEIGDGVTRLGANAFAALDDAVTVDGTTLDKARFIAPALGPVTPVQPAGAISPAACERIEIIDGKAYLGVSVYTSDSLTNPNWSVATNGVFVVPAPGKQGFFYLFSKPAAPSSFEGADPGEYRSADSNATHLHEDQ